MISSAVLVSVAPVQGHGIAGNRLFPGTLAMDDPAVSDEASLPTVSTVAPPIESGVSRDDRISWSFTRLLTPTVAFTIDSGWIHRNWLSGQRGGFDRTIVGLKAEVYRSNAHEALIAATLGWGIGGSGERAVGAHAADTIHSGIFFGKGFGDLPDRFAWLRPFAVTGAVSAEFPTRTTATNLDFDPASGQLALMLTS